MNRLKPNVIHHVEAFHWVRAIEISASCSSSLIGPSGLAWHTEETTLRQKFEEFGPVEEAVRQTPWEPCPGSHASSLSKTSR